MSAVLSGLLHRRVLPLARQIERWAAPAAIQQFSSAAEGPAAGAGSGAAAAGSSTSSSGPGYVARGPRRDGGTGGYRPRQNGAEGGSGGGSRHLGAMSQLLQREQGPGRRGAPGGGQHTPWRRPRDGPFGGGGGGGDWEPEDVNVNDLPPEVRDYVMKTPLEILGEFNYALKVSADETPIPVQEAFTDIADLANLDHLPLLRYYMTPQQWLQFCSGRMEEDDQNVLMDRLAAALLADERYWEKQEELGEKFAADADYDLGASLGSAPALRGTTRPRPAPPAELAAELEAQRASIMEELAIDEEEFEAAKAATVRQVALAAARAAAPALPDHTMQARRLTALLDKALPKDHHNYGPAKQRLAVVQGNPGWSQERKMVFTKRLLKRMASPAYASG